MVSQREGKKHICPIGCVLLCKCRWWLCKYSSPQVPGEYLCNKMRNYNISITPNTQVFMCNHDRNLGHILSRLFACVRENVCVCLLSIKLRYNQCVSLSHSHECDFVMFIWNKLISLNPRSLCLSLSSSLCGSPLSSQSHCAPHPLVAGHSRLKITPLKDIALSGCTFEPFSNLV